MAARVSSPIAQGPANAEPEPHELLEAAAAHCRLGQYDAVRLVLEQALDAAVERSSNTAVDLLPILNGLDQVYLRLGDLRKAWKCAERALKVAEGAFGGDSTELVEPLNVLVAAYFALGFLDQCYRAAERALAILKASLGEDDVEVALARDRLGVALAEMGAFERARELHLRALAVLRTSGRQQEIAATLANVAATYLAEADLQSARQWYEQALAMARTAFGEKNECVATYLALYGDYWLQAGDDGRALQQYREALAVKRATLGELHPEIAALLFKIGRTEYQHDKTAGRETLLQAIAVLDVRFHRPRLFADICSFLARELAPSSAAIFFWKLAVNEIESLRSHVARLDGVLERTFLKQNSDDFRALGENLIAFGRLPEAQHVLTMIKEHELFSLTQVDARRTKVPLTRLEVHWVRRGWKLLRRMHGSLEAGWRAQGADPIHAPPFIAGIVQIGKDLDAEFKTLLADFAAADAETDDGDRSALSLLPDGGKQDLTPGTALLQYMLMPDHCSMNIIVTTSIAQRQYRLAFQEGEVNKLVYAMREALQNRSEHFLPVAQRLYQMLVAPMADVLAADGVKTLSFSLDGVLRYLPMAALHDGRNYLIERFALILATEAVAPRAQSELVHRAAGLGVSRPLGGYQPLFGVRDELHAVIRTAHEHGGVLPGIIRLDQAFTADALVEALSSQYSVIHVASHFVFAAARESSSYLLLGDGSKLTLADFGDLRFDATDLVVLSACNTAVGGGHHQNGHEIEGLGALVRHQGANQVLATLWPVADMTTVALMRAFYRNRYSVGLSPQEALRGAQFTLLRGEMVSSADHHTRSLVDPDEERADGHVADTRHPYYWAPYILMAALPHAPPPGLL